MRISKNNFQETDRFFLFQEFGDKEIYCLDLHKEFFPVLLAEKPRFEAVGSIHYQDCGLFSVGVFEMTEKIIADLNALLDLYPEGTVSIFCKDPLELLPYDDFISDRVTMYLTEEDYTDLLLFSQALNEPCRRKM